MSTFLPPNSIPIHPNSSNLVLQIVVVVSGPHQRDAYEVLRLFALRMMLGWLCGRLGWGEKYDCIILDLKEYLEEAVGLLPLEIIVVDSSIDGLWEI
jgi:hypothetical protein